MEKVLVAMSGGVDSSCAAYLLKKQGYDVAGAFMHLWIPRECVDSGTPSCCSQKSREDAQRVAEKLDIPFYVFDFQDEFQKYVVDYFKEEYLAGRTPNPCIVCNEQIKFELFLNKAKQMGMDKIATGHYAFCELDTNSERYILREGKDDKKDQSYFLFSLTQIQLAHTLFPLSQYTKESIKALAKKEEFFLEDKKESQEVCFVLNQTYVDFLKTEYRIKDKPGNIKDTNGNIVGRHNGYFYFTIGQRRGLGIGARHPLYVVRIDKEQNEVIVGEKTEVLKTEFTVDRLSWLSKVYSAGEFIAQVRIRYNQNKVNASVEVRGNCATVTFLEAQEAVTPGQAAVFYDSDLVVGGGWIEG